MLGMHVNTNLFADRESTMLIVLIAISTPMKYEIALHFLHWAFQEKTLAANSFLFMQPNCFTETRVPPDKCGSLPSWLCRCLRYQTTMFLITLITVLNALRSLFKKRQSVTKQPLRNRPFPFNSPLNSVEEIPSECNDLRELLLRNFNWSCIIVL